MNVIVFIQGSSYHKLPFAMHGCRPTKRPNFFWQGLLIVLPAILLAAIGLLSLRQDRILAEHDALALARRIAAEVASRQIPNSLHVQPSPLTDVSAFCAAPTRPSADPVFAYSVGPNSRLACLLNENGELLYPPPLRGLPISQAFDEEELSDEQRLDWADLRDPQLAESDPLKAANAGRNLLQSQLPERFAAAATYRLATLLRSAGDIANAWQLFEVVVRDGMHLAGETGVSLGLCAHLQLLELSAAAPEARSLKAELLNSICARLVLEPSALSRTVLEALLEPGSAPVRDSDLESDLSAAEVNRTSVAVSNSSSVIDHPWRRVWDIHEASRRLYEHLRETLGELVIEGSERLEGCWTALDGDEPRLITFQAIEGGLWVFAQAEPGVHEAVQRELAMQTIPPYFGIQIEVAGQAILESANTGLVLATSFGPGTRPAIPAQTVAGGTLQASSAFPGVEAGAGPGLIKVTVRLTEPALLYARQRIRTIWFGSLIAVSALAVIVGFVIARRAFVRQEQLSEMKTNFVSSVSHELRAPIASVRLMAEELEDIGPQDRQKNKEYHRFIVQECRRLSALIENVLDFSRHEQGRKLYEFEPTDLVALVEETVKLMRAYGAGRCIGVDSVVTGSPVPTEVDGRAIQQILVNLIDNAIKHSPPGSTVTVGLELPPASDPAALVMNHESRITLDTLHVTLWVEDHGEGIPPEDHERIFERFYRRGSELRRETQGVGLGLAIVKLVTEAHGGKVSVRSAPGHGSRFTVVLPLLPSENQPRLT